jgi:putative acetyltransferase
MTEIREEKAEDIAAIRNVNEQAFGQSQEADLVDALRRSCREILSLVAVVDGQITAIFC